MQSKNRIRAFISYHLSLTDQTVAQLAKYSSRGRSNYSDMVANNPMNLRLADCEHMLDFLKVTEPEERLNLYREVIKQWKESVQS